jgi:hypothetical protein
MWWSRGDLSKFPELNKKREQVISFVTSNYGSDLAMKLFGKTSDEILLPAIPSVNKDVKSLDVYKDKEEGLDKKLKSIPEEERKKYDLSFIREIYDVTRETRATDDDFANWMNVLGQGGSREGVYRAVVLDSYYYSLENMSHPVNKSVVDFTDYFLGNFLNQKVDTEVIGKMNFYMLKRIITERTLDTIDIIKRKREDIFAWYAVFSGEMGRLYTGAFQNELRQEKLRKRHLKWAENAPFQYIKSEIIIKLHKVFNFLNKKID